MAGTKLFNVDLEVEGAIKVSTTPNATGNILTKGADGTISIRTPAQIKSDIGLGNVDNTSDLSKPISTATQTALNGKENISNKATSFGTLNNTLYPTTQAVANYVGNGTLSISAGTGLTGSGSFSANQSSNSSVSIGLSAATQNNITLGVASYNAIGFPLSNLNTNNKNTLVEAINQVNTNLVLLNNSYNNNAFLWVYKGEIPSVPLVLKTDMTRASSSRMAYFRIEGNSYNSHQPPYDFSFQFYKYQPIETGFLELNGVSTGLSPTSIHVFYDDDGFLSIRIFLPSNYLSLKVHQIVSNVVAGAPKITSISERALTQTEQAYLLNIPFKQVAYTDQLPTAAQITNWNTAFSWGDPANKYVKNSVGTYTPFESIDLNTKVFGRILTVLSGSSTNVPNIGQPGMYISANEDSASQIVGGEILVSRTGRMAIRGNNAVEKGSWKEVWTSGDFTVGQVANWNTAFTNNHTHANKSVLDGITSGKVTNWDTAFGWGNHSGLYLPLSGGTMSNTNLVSNLNSQYLRGYAHNEFTKEKVLINTVAMHSSGYYLIRIKPINHQMFSLKISVYQNYQRYELDIAAYNYASLTPWYATAITLNNSTLSSLDVIIGYYSSSDLYIAIPRSNYAGIKVHDFLEGYSRTTDWVNNITLEEYDSLASLPGTVLETRRVYRPMNIAHPANEITSDAISNWNTAYIHSQIVNSNPHGTTFAQILSKPTTLAGFGITDAYTKTQTDGRYLQSETDTLHTVTSRNATTPNGITVGSVSVAGAAGSYRSFIMRTNNLDRWAIYANNVAENGSNSGSDFSIARYSDAGTIMSEVFSISRSTGISTFGAQINVPGSNSTQWGAAYTHSQITNSNPHGTTFAQIVSKPTTISGFGITDAYTKSESDARYLDTLDSVLSRGGSSARTASFGALSVNGPAATYRDLTWRTNGNLRWDLFTDPTPETGGNTGSNLYLGRFDDAGSYLGMVFAVNRATGDFTFGSPVHASGSSSDNWSSAYTHSQTTGNPHGTTFAQLNAKPTTLDGYGITDAVTLNTQQTITATKGFTKPTVQKLGASFQRIENLLNIADSISTTQTSIRINLGDSMEATMYEVELNIFRYSSSVTPSLESQQTRLRITNYNVPPPDTNMYNNSVSVFEGDKNIASSVKIYRNASNHHIIIIEGVFGQYVKVNTNITLHHGGATDARVASLLANATMDFSDSTTGLTLFKTINSSSFNKYADDSQITALTNSKANTNGSNATGTWGIGISGNAASSTKLATARTINGTSFDGTANITTANWGTARTLTIGNTGKSVNGSGNIAWSLAEILTAGSNIAINGNTISAINTNTTYSAGTGLSLTGTTFGQTITTNGTGSFVTGITQTANGFQVNLGTPPNTDTVTRLRGTTSGTLVSGDITLAAGSNVTITQSGNTITIGATGGTGFVDLTTNQTIDGIKTFVKTIYSQGDIVSFSTSDRRLKKNIKPLEGALDKVKSIGGYSYEWEEEAEFEGKDVGIIAQEIEEIFPEVVVTRDNGYKAVKYEKVIPLLIEAIKELSKQVDELKNGVSK